MNTFILTGEVKKITINEPKDAKRGASAILLIQYGVQREATGGAVEFVNATLVRVPSYKFPALRSRLRQGQAIEVMGHIQGVYKNVVDQGFFTVELVADRIDLPGAVSAPEPESAELTAAAGQ